MLLSLGSGGGELEAKGGPSCERESDDCSEEMAVCLNSCATARGHAADVLLKLATEKRVRTSERNAQQCQQLVVAYLLLHDAVSTYAKAMSVR